MLRRAALGWRPAAGDAQWQCAEQNGAVGGRDSAAVLDLLDWQRETARLYAAVRAERHPRTAHAGWAAVRARMVAEHPCSPVRRDASAALAVPEHDPAWRVEVRLDAASPTRLVLPTTTGAGVPVERVGVVRTPWGTLDVWWLDGYGGGLWLPVRDAGSGTLSSAGGRCLYDTAQGADLGVGADGGLVVDLNFLHVPARDRHGDALLAPLGNVLDVVVPVGELMERG